MLVTVEPGCAPESTSYTKVSCAVVLAGRVAIVQDEMPPSGAVQVNVGPDCCVSDWKVELVATVTVNVTFAASFGPLFVTNTVKGALDPGDTAKGAVIGHHRSTFALPGS